nr:MAG TPA: hypothetical protein [Caudoviricetes sp.]
MSGMFKPLGAEDIECRIAQTKPNGASILLYKTARTDANQLDDVVGVANWQNDYKVIDGTLFCGIGIRAEDGWVWKWDAGSESNVAKDKGEASDAFKRAGFRFGIGRELYTAPFIWIPAGKCTIKRATKNGKEVSECYDRFRVAEIEYADSKITHLVIENVTMGVKVFFWDRVGTSPKPATADDEPWDAQTAKRAIGKMTAKQVDAISALVKETFCGHELTRDAFHAVTGYTVQQLAARQIPADQYDTLVSKLTLEPEDAVKVIEEIEHGRATA